MKFWSNHGHERANISEKKGIFKSFKHNLLHHLQSVEETPDLINLHHVNTSSLCI